MENQKKFILSLDVSTSTVGCTLFLDEGDKGVLAELTHFELKSKVETRLEKYIAKADYAVLALHDKFSEYNIHKIIVEEPLLNSMNQKTANTLDLFNEYFCNKLEKEFNIPVEFISVNDSRKYALPELIGKNGRMYSDLPKLICNQKKSAWSKLLIMYLVSQRYKNIKWLLNNALKIDKNNFDRADSVVVGIGYMVKHGYWEKMGKFQHWGGMDISTEKCVEFITENINYENYCKTNIDKNKSLTPKEKRNQKLLCLRDNFNIGSFVNLYK